MIDYRKFKSLREEQDLTQDDLSKLSDVTTVTISTIENGHRDRIQLFTLRKLAKALKVKPAELLK